MQAPPRHDRHKGVKAEPHAQCKADDTFCGEHLMQV
jgi:hypothetical protein